jgi:hypothetical protein
MGIGTISIIVGIIVGIIAIVESITGFFRRLLRKFKNPNALSIPAKTLVLLAIPSEGGNKWCMGSLNNSPAMQIYGGCYATNTTTLDIQPVAAILRKPYQLSDVRVKKSDSDGHESYGSYNIPSAATTIIIFDFLVAPPIRKQGEQFIADIAILDQFGNKHWIKGMIFGYYSTRRS